MLGMTLKCSSLQMELHERKKKPWQDYKFKNEKICVELENGELAKQLTPHLPFEWVSVLIVPTNLRSDWHAGVYKVKLKVQHCVGVRKKPVLYLVCLNVVRNLK